MIKTIKLLSKDLVNFVYPNLCSACLTVPPIKGDVLCIKCKWEMPYTDQFDIADNELEMRLKLRFEFSRAAALFQFQSGGKVEEMIYGLKYRRKRLIGIQLGKHFGQKLKAARMFPPCDAIIPIPVHPAKLRTRGYNQAMLFAAGISEATSIPTYGNVLIKKEKSDSQTKKSRLERLENVLNSFEILNDSKIKGKKVLLVDDVITTGATIEAAAIKLFEAGIKELSLGFIAMKLK